MRLHIARPLLCAVLAVGVSAPAVLSPLSPARAAASCNLGCGTLYGTGFYDIQRFYPVALSRPGEGPKSITPSLGSTGGSGLSVSPDGNQLLFMGGAYLQVSDLRTGKVTTLIPYTPGLTIKYPSWSPDGRQIAFTLDDTRKDALAPQGVAVADTRTGAISVEWVVEDHDRQDPAWLPDGRTVIASEQESNAQGPYRALIALDLATGASHQITQDPTHDYNRPVVSPDGRRLVVVRSDRNSANNPSLVLMNVDGSQPRVLTTAGGFSRLAWSPDGTMIAYGAGAQVMLLPINGGAPVMAAGAPSGDLASSNAGASAHQAGTRSFGPGPGVRAGCSVRCGTIVVNGGLALYSLNAAAKTVRRVTATGTTQEPDKEPSISPDGRTLAYIVGGGDSVALIPLAGGTGRRIGDLPFPDAPAWSPNGSAIAVGYNNAAGGYHGIGIMDAASGAQIYNYSPLGAGPLEPAWAPDGHALVMSQSKGNVFDLVELNLDNKNVRVIAHDQAHSFFHAQVSPDGRLVAAIRIASVGLKTGDLWVMNRDGSGGHALVSGVLEDQIAWAPDGQSIAANTQSVIVAYPLHGGRPTPLIRHAAQVAWMGQ